MTDGYLHAPRDRLTSKTLNLHYAISSLKEELDAVDWYRQRADDTEDASLKEILLHNMREEIEHASMLFEWLRRNDADFAKQIATYLFSEAPITEIELETEGTQGVEDGLHKTGRTAASPRPPASGAAPAVDKSRRFTIGTLKSGG